MLLKMFFVLDKGGFILPIRYITVVATGPMTQDN